jgi:hypothetical protein
MMPLLNTTELLFKVPSKAQEIVNLRDSYVPAEPNRLGLHLFVVLHAGQPFPSNARF